MALEAVVFPQDYLGYTNKDLYSLVGGNIWSCQHTDDDSYSNSFHLLDNQSGSSSTAQDHDLYGNINGEYWSPSSPPSMAKQPNLSSDHAFEPDPISADVSATSLRPKRRRPKSRKNQEDIENQRMTHITVERNRRKQMNEYLSVLRNLMPESYVQRGDQASIIGGAINFVKELEHQLQLASGQKEKSTNGGGSFCPFGDFFSFPQYSSSGRQSSSAVEERPRAVESGSGIADIEVTMVESHANLKIRLKKRPALLSKVAAGLGGLRLTILHLNFITVEQTVLCSLCVKVEDDCKLTSVDDLATAVYHLLGRI